MTVSDQYDIDPTLVRDDDGVALLWIEPHNRALTVVDTGASARELGYRDDSDIDVDALRNEWLEATG